MQWLCLADPPTNCSAKPNVTLSDGSWPDGCAGTAVGQNCTANCTWGGSATTTCLATGQWSTSVIGQCAGEVEGWPGWGPSHAEPQCHSAEAVLAVRCCNWSCTLHLLCADASVGWQLGVSVFCFAGAPTGCAAKPTATISGSGSWPNSCAGLAIGAVCVATCTFGGLATVVCLAGGTWASVAVGTCL